ncbi:hypothetical protein FQZ97_1184930 [compost metagenome]
MAGLQRGQRHGGGGVAAGGLQDGLGAGLAGAALALQRVGHHETVALGRHHHELRPQRAHAFERELEQAFAVDEGHELLGKALAAERPEPGAGAAAEDDGSDHEWQSVMGRNTGKAGLKNGYGRATEGAAVVG